MKDIKVERLTVLGGTSGGGNGASLGAKLIGASEQVKAATGVDLMAAAAKGLTPRNGQ
jgi:hypothetical protein